MRGTLFYRSGKLYARLLRRSVCCKDDSRTTSKWAALVWPLLAGASAQFASLMDLHRRSGINAKLAPEKFRAGATSYLHIEKTSQEPINGFYAYHSHYFKQLGRSRGRMTPCSRSAYEQSANLQGVCFVGDSQ
jgi:hypothetical protein